MSNLYLSTCLYYLFTLYLILVVLLLEVEQRYKHSLAEGFPHHRYIQHWIWVMFWPHFNFEGMLPHGTSCRSTRNKHKPCSTSPFQGWGSVHEAIPFLSAKPDLGNRNLCTFNSYSSSFLVNLTVPDWFFPHTKAFFRVYQLSLCRRITR